MPEESPSSLLKLKSLAQNKLGFLSVLYILILGLVSIFAYYIAPDSSSNANQMHLEIHSKPPGFEALILSTQSFDGQKQAWWDMMINGKQNPREEQVITSYISNSKELSYLPYGADDESLRVTLPQDLIPSTIIENRKFIWGTDKYGRDLLSRMIIGSRISFFIGFIAVFISLIIGLTLGALSGYYGGRIDRVIMWFINVTWSIPTLLLVIAITLALGKGYWQVFIAVGLTMWVEVARVVRGQIISLKQQQYIEAAKVLGFSDLRIISQHLIPNILGPVIVICAANFAGAILIESGLSFLGIGAQPPTPSWGGIIKDHYNYLLMGKAYLAIIPGVAIMTLVMAFMILGNSLRDYIDVKS
jgi:peptide/nickel transport system permease protein